MSWLLLTISASRLTSCYIYIGTQAKLEKTGTARSGLWKELFLRRQPCQARFRVVRLPVLEPVHLHWYSFFSDA